MIEEMTTATAADMTAPASVAGRDPTAGVRIRDIVNPMPIDPPRAAGNA